MADANLTVQCRATVATTGTDGSSGPMKGDGVGESEPSDFQRMLGAGRPAAQAETTVHRSGSDLATDAGTGEAADDRDPDIRSGAIAPGSATDPTQIDALLGIGGDGQRAGATPQLPAPVAPTLPLAGCVALQVASATTGPSVPIVAATSDAGATLTAGAGTSMPGNAPAVVQGTTAGNSAASPAGAATGDATPAATNSAVAPLYASMVERPDSGGARPGLRASVGRGSAPGAAANQASALALQAAAGDPLQGVTAQTVGLPDPRTQAASSLDAAVVAALRATVERSADAPVGASSVDGSDAGAVGSSPLAAAGVAAAHHGAASREATAAASLAPPVNSPVGSLAWRDQIAGRVSWMIDNGEQQASLRLSPENLGPLEVRIAVREGEASVWFGASQPETRAALEQAMPRLREMLAGSGLSLTNSGVFSDSPRDPWRALASAGMARASLESGLGDLRAAATPVRVARGLLDLYA
jgi:flagellar hook-length control protein FliK